MNQALTPEQRRRYEAEGFLVLSGYLDAPTVADLAREADDLLTRIGPIVPENPRIQVDEIGGGYRVRQLWPVIDVSEAFARLAADERITGLFRSLFGDTPVLFEDKLNYKYPGGGSPFPMHQDYGYWQGHSPDLTTAMIYLDAADAENGCLEVVPGAHKRGLLERGEMRISARITDHHIEAETLDPATAVPVSGPPGTLILFSGFAPHASAPNLSDRSRRAILFTYYPARDGDAYEETSGAARERANAWRAATSARAAAGR